MEIENFKLIDFLNQDPQLIHDYSTLLSCISPAKTKREVIHMKLKHVELIRNTLSSGTDIDLIKAVAKVEKIKRSMVLDIPIIRFFAIVNAIKKQFEKIVRAEESSLTPKHINQKFEMVDGSKRMAKFGIYNTLESISNGNALEYRKYMNMSYSEVFTILLMRKEASDIQTEMNQIKDK